MRKIGLIWDLDGTLINSENEVLACLIKAIRQVGLTEEQQIKPFRVGPTIDKILDESFSKEIMNIQMKNAIIMDFRNRYDNCEFNKTMPFEGIKKILELSNIDNYIVTNKPDLATNRIISKLGWRKYFKKIVTPYTKMRQEQERKSKTELFSEIIQSTQNDFYIGIGDMATDAIAAKNNNIEAIGVLWGTGTKKELEEIKCTKIFSKVKELFEYLNYYENK